MTEKTEALRTPPGGTLLRGALFILALPFFVDMSVLAQPVAPTVRQLQLEQEIRGLSQVRAAVERSERPVRVIAQYSEVAADPAGSRTAALPMRGLSAATLASAKQRVSNTLTAQGIANVKAIEGLPHVTFELTRDQMTEMADSGQFAIIVEDKLSKPYLGSSGPVIGVPDLHDMGATGNGRTVAILDTGVDIDHPFLSGRVIEGACFSSNFPTHGATSLCPGGADSATTVASGNHCTDIDGCDHGTHVAGIAAGRSAGSISITGVAPDASIMAVQVFSRFDDAPGGPDTCAAVANAPSPCVLSYDSDQIRGLQRVFERANDLDISAANMSLGGGRFTGTCDTENAALKAIIDQLLTQDAATVIAAGNDGFTDAIGSPGCVSTAVTVGSTTDADSVSGFSNLSDTVDVLAPGSSIESSVPGTGFAVFNGTSMATPQVAGAFAAISSCAPPGTTVAQIEAALVSEGTSVTDSRSGGLVTKSRIDVGAAAQAICEDNGCKDQVDHNLANLRLKSSGWWFWKKWWIVDGSHQLFYFGRNGSEAQESLDVINNFGFTSTCYIGRPDASMQYLQVGDSVPGGSHGGLDCISFNRAGIRIEPAGGGQFRLTDGVSSLLIFPNQAEGQEAVDAINHHRLNRQCFVGRPDPSFTFWLAE